jgi:autotransporter translocation and assembly factor TamB
MVQRDLAGTLKADLAAPTFAHLGLSPAHGEARLTFGMRGHLPTPHLEADLQLRHTRFQDITVEQLRLTLEADRSTVKIRSLTGAHGEGRFQLSGVVQLSAPFHLLHRSLTTFPIQSITDVALRAERVHLAHLAPLLPVSVPVAGELSMQVQAAGSWPEVHGEGEVTLHGLVVRGEPLGDVSIAGAGSPAQLTLKRLVATVGGGHVQAQGTATPRQRWVDVAMTWQGVRLERLAVLQGLNVPISGELSGNVRTRSIWPDLRAEVTTQGPQWQAYGLEIADLQLHATGSLREVALERLSTRIAGARLTTGRATIGGSLDLRLSSEGIPLRGFSLLPQGFPLGGASSLR